MSIDHSRERPRWQTHPVEDSAIWTVLTPKQEAYVTHDEDEWQRLNVEGLSFFGFSLTLNNPTSLRPAYHPRFA
jgi:hypothetical protein